MSSKGVKVYWCSKTVTGGPWFINWLTRLGNHHFAMILVDIIATDGKKPKASKFRKSKSGRYYYLTLSVQSTDMVLYPNGAEDILTVQKWVDDGARHLRFDLNEVPPVGGDGMKFANKILSLATVYNSRVGKKTFEYDFMDLNCASIINSLFKAAGVSQSTREDCGEFNQLDWGEEAEVPITYFR